MFEISGNTIFEHGGCFFLMLGLRSAVTEISRNTIFVEPQSLIKAYRWISDEADLQLLCRASSRGGSKMGTGNLGQ